MVSSFFLSKTVHCTIFPLWSEFFNLPFVRLGVKQKLKAFMSVLDHRARLAATKFYKLVPWHCDSPSTNKVPVRLQCKGLELTRVSLRSSTRAPLRCARACGPRRDLFFAYPALIPQRASALGNVPAYYHPSRQGGTRACRGERST